MGLLNMTDQEIATLAKPILLDTIYGANNKDWRQFAKHMLEEDFNDQESKEDVERQWNEDDYLSQFTDSPKFLGIIRKLDCVVVLWKLTTPSSKEEYLERLTLIERDNKIYQVGIWTD